jgi:hypothetical protein
MVFRVKLGGFYFNQRTEEEKRTAAAEVKVLAV